MNPNLKPGLHCKACNAALNAECLDPELCNSCMEVVSSYNKDLDKEYFDEFTKQLESK